MFEAILSPSKVRIAAITSVSQRLWHPFWFALISALGMTLLLNGPFLAAVQAKVPGQYGLQLDLMAILFLLNLLLLVLFSFRRLQKPMVLVLFAIGAFSYYFIDSFGIVIDKDMLQNAFETDPAEAQAVLTVSMVWQVLGASDEDLFTTAHQQLTTLHQQHKPFFSLIFTSSNHEPFEFPDGRIDLHEEPKNTVNNAVKYADWAMGQFFQKAQQSDYWKDTLFLIVADHDNRVYGDNLIPVEKFHIPGLILGADTQPELLKTLASQIDLAPTLLSMMGISSCHTMTGRDFSLDKTSPGRALLQFENYFALMQQGAGQQLVILKPNGETVAGVYQSEQQNLHLNQQAVSLTDKNKALALVQLPSYLYREQKNFSEASCI